MLSDCKKCSSCIKRAVKTTLTVSFGNNAQLDNFPNSLSILFTKSCILSNVKDQISRQLKESFTSFFALKPFDHPRDLGMESLEKETFMK